jgi:hypothetical protein
MILDPNVWGPHYWFFLHTIALNYPQFPNTVSKKKYYDFISNIPLFIPVDAISVYFSELLDQYPVTPYLDSRDDFIRWMHFIHNKINDKIEKPKVSLNDFYINYYNAYKPKIISMKEVYKWKEKIIYMILIIFIVFLILYLYNK